MEIRIRNDDGILILGKRGSGKTTLAKFLYHKLNFPRTLILDCVGIWRGLGKNYILVNPQADDIDPILKKVMEKGNYFIFIDEADRYPYSPMLSEMVNLGRNWGIGYLAIARRTANIHKDFMANANWTFIFQTTQERDIQHIINSYDVNPEQLIELDKYEFLVINDNTVLGKGKIENDKFVFKGT